MTNGMGPYLAVDNSAQMIALKKFGHLSESVWADITREEAQRIRPFLLLGGVSFDGVPEISEETANRVRRFLRNEAAPDTVEDEFRLADERAKTIQSAILEQLRDKYNGSMLRTSHISHAEFEPIDELLRSIARNCFIPSAVGGLNQEGKDLAKRNVKRAYLEIADIIWRKVGFLRSREEIEARLRKKGIYIRDETLTKLMLFEINRNRTDPAVLVLPNPHHPYNPLVCAVEYDEVFPDLRSALSLFAFLDELPEAE